MGGLRATSVAVLREEIPMAVVKVEHEQCGGTGLELSGNRAAVECDGCEGRGFFEYNYVPQMKLLLQFERLLKARRLLITANLFLRDSKGGTYLKSLKNEKKWVTGVFADTAISTKLK